MFFCLSSSLCLLHRALSCCCYCCAWVSVYVLLPFFCYFTVLCTLFFTSLILLCLESLSKKKTLVYYYACATFPIHCQKEDTDTHKKTLVKRRKNFISFLMASTKPPLLHTVVHRQSSRSKKKIKIQKDPNHIFNLLFTDHPTIRLFISIILM